MAILTFLANKFTESKITECNYLEGQINYCYNMGFQFDSSFRTSKMVVVNFHN